MLVSLTIKGQKNISGYYSSKYSHLELYPFHLQLNDDSTFIYVYNGHMIKDKSNGMYRLTKEKFIHLEYDEMELDSVELVAKTFALRVRPVKMRYKSRKLYILDANNSIDKRNYLVKRKGRSLPPDKDE